MAISNRRPVGLKGGRVHFRRKDYARGGKRRIMKLVATEFLRRFLLHVLPPGFVRVRHYGFLANRHRQGRLMLCRELLSDAAPPGAASPSAAPGPGVAVTKVRCAPLCPACGLGRMVVVEELYPTSGGRERRGRPVRCAAFDTS